jgi:hypothetical protein
MRPLIILVLKWVLAIGLLAGLLWMSRDNLQKLQGRQILWGAFGIALLRRSHGGNCWYGESDCRLPSANRFDWECWAKPSIRWGPGRSAAI